jgi:hypothetical protein
VQARRPAATAFQCQPGHLLQDRMHVASERSPL